MFTFIIKIQILININLLNFERPISIYLIFFFFVILFIGLWNLASLFSNLCLFVLMPFAFFFLESEGFAGLKKVSKLNFELNLLNEEIKYHSY
jgi:hypothetical protein